MLWTKRGAAKFVFSLGVVLIAGVALRPARPAAFAQFFPFQRNKAQPIDPAQAFLEGYRAYRSGDYTAAIGRLELAASNFTAAGDYALYYLAAARAASGDQARAADNYWRVSENYPQSILRDSAQLDYAQIELKLGNLQNARASAGQVVQRTGNPTIEEQARMVIAQAAYRSNDFSIAYAEAQRLRERFPRDAIDAEARALARTIASEHPSVTGPSALHYQATEGALLAREGQLGAAREAARAALALEPPPAMRVELYWVLAEAASGNDAEAKAALLRYLAMAPRGAHAADALNRLAHQAWRINDTPQARDYFSRIVLGFPGSDSAANAMFEIGRTYEDDGDYAAARNEYLRLGSRFTRGEAVDSARFRAPFMLYMQRRYAAAAPEMARARDHAPAADWAMFSYWQARALEQTGDRSGAQSLMVSVARDTQSNYYPALASKWAGIEPDQFAAAVITDPIAGAAPAADGVADFHLTRVVAFRQIGLRELEPAELRLVATDNNPAMRNWVLAEMQASGAWYDAIQLATSMLTRGEIYPALAERIRYPRGFWELVSVEAARTQLDPWLVAALIRQESLYNPAARSVSDARGLMQLLPTTAERWASAAGIGARPLDLYRPETSVRIGTTYLKGLFEMFDGDQFRAVAAYNGGEHAVAGWIAKYPGDDDQWVENIGYKETRDYVKKVIGGAREYRLLYAPRPAAASSRMTPQSPG